MNDTNDSQKNDFKDISGLHLSRLLRLGISEKRRPVDELIERLAATDGGSWLGERLDEFAPAAPASLEDVLVSGQGSLDDVTRLKNRGNAQLREASDKDALLGAMALYFLSIAAALAHHRCLITSQKQEHLDPIFLDLAQVAPAPWDQLLERAVS